MSLPRRSKEIEQPGWLQGRGQPPQIAWRLGTDGQLVDFCYAREAAEVILTDSSPSLVRATRSGQIQAMIRLKDPLQSLVWSDDGSAGAAIVNNNTLVRFDRMLQTEFMVSLPDTAQALAISPYGNHIAVGLLSGMNLIFNERKKKVAQFETVRPLAYMQFCGTEPLLFAAAEHGLLCCHDLQGAEVWQERLWSNVGGLEIAGDGSFLYLPGFSHGIQTFGGDGAPVGSYVLDGTIDSLAVSYEPQRLFAGSIERQLYWLDSDGELIWTTQLSDDIVRLACDPLGEWGLVGLQNEGLCCLDWR